MNCLTAEQRILEAIDGELSSTERDRLEEHLSSCAACRQISDEYRQLARLSHHWVPQVKLTDRSDDVFAAQVLARIAEAPRRANSPLWLPLLFFAASVACLTLIPHTLWPTMPYLGDATNALPEWLLSTGRMVPVETAAIWNAAQRVSAVSPLWAVSLLGGACFLNLLFYTLAVQSRLKGSPS
jgi:anti-sigma factor RsiW